LVDDVTKSGKATNLRLATTPSTRLESSFTSHQSHHFLHDGGNSEEENFGRVFRSTCEKEAYDYIELTQWG
jgi:hypothetical protein